jgi:hypothetical protein
MDSIVEWRKVLNLLRNFFHAGATSADCLVFTNSMRDFLHAVRLPKRISDPRTQVFLEKKTLL